jgi:hypothetical protein
MAVADLASMVVSTVAAATVADAIKAERTAH